MAAPQQPAALDDAASGTDTTARWLAGAGLLVGALAFYLSVRTDAPLAAVGGTVFIVIVSSILGQVEALGDIRNALPTSYNFAWVGMLGDPPDTADMASGVGWSLLYSAVLIGLSFWHFGRKDVTS